MGGDSDRPLFSSRPPIAWQRSSRSADGAGEESPSLARIPAAHGVPWVESYNVRSDDDGSLRVEAVRKEGQAPFVHGHVHIPSADEAALAPGSVLGVEVMLDRDGERQTQWAYVALRDVGDDEIVFEVDEEGLSTSSKWLVDVACRDLALAGGQPCNELRCQLGHLLVVLGDLLALRSS